MARAMQPPTCRGLRVRSIADCNIIFHAVALGIVPLVSRRLSIEERRAIQSGCVFVWEERSPTIEVVGDGLERWTDSRRWGASRLAKDFLLYQEKLPEVSDPHVRTAMHHNRLVKQTYSVYVDRPDGRRKWHLVAYSSPETGHFMPTVDNIPELAALQYRVPEGKYQPARYSKTRSRQEAVHDDPAEPPQLGGSVIEFPTSSVAGGSNSSPELTPPLLSHSRPQPILAPSPIVLSPPTAIQHATCLPKIAPPPPVRPDPEWVLRNCVAVVHDVRYMQTRGVFGEDSSKDMAPLVYVRRSPYRQRHPLDNDALRALDAFH